MRVDKHIEICQDSDMAMNPWITDQLADARIDDLRRSAALARLARDVVSRDGRSPERRWASRVARPSRTATAGDCR
jgi:hypothetical protein